MNHLQMICYYFLDRIHWLPSVKPRKKAAKVAFKRLKTLSMHETYKNIIMREAVFNWKKDRIFKYYSKKLFWAAIADVS